MVRPLKATDSSAFHVVDLNKNPMNRNFELTKDSHRTISRHSGRQAIINRDYSKNFLYEASMSIA